MYNEIVEETINNDLKTPFYGIRFPNLENKHNLLRRQLLIEETSFENANNDFIKIFNSMQNINKAHELFFNRKMIIQWHGALNYAIAEYQKNTVDTLEAGKLSEKKFLSKIFHWV